jgi:hypothetical protein
MPADFHERNLRHDRLTEFSTAKYCQNTIIIVPQVAICGEGSALSPWVMVATELAQLELPFIFNKSEAQILLDKHEQKFYRK